MADNYIEKQYEQYEARKAAWKKAGKPTLKKSSTPPKEPKRRVFVTGGASGIGKAIVQAFCNADCLVAFCDHNEASGRMTAIETGALFYQVDVSNPQELEECMKELFDTWGDIDVIINNVGVGNFAPITDISIEDFDKVININLRSVFITSQQLALHRQKLETPNLYGRIINLCSTRYLMSEAGSEAYAASKGGVYSLTHALALSMSKWHITVNSISPGWIENNEYDKLRDEDHKQHPSQRVGKPEDIARACVFLCKPDNDFINGENITIDGGMTKKMIYIE